MFVGQLLEAQHGTHKVTFALPVPKRGRYGFVPGHLALTVQEKCVRCGASHCYCHLKHSDDVQRSEKPQINNPDKDFGDISTGLV